MQDMPKNKTFFTYFSLFMLFSLLGCEVDLGAGGTTSKGKTDQEILARMGKAGQGGVVTLTVGAFQEILKYGDPKVVASLNSDPALLKKAIQEELLKKYLRVQAQKAGVEKQAGVAFLMKNASNQILIDQFVASRTQLPGDFPSESLIQENYKQNVDKFLLPAQLHLAQIFLLVPKEATEEDKALLRKKMAEIRAKVAADDRHFSDLAIKHSHHKASAARGGDMGWLFYADLLPEMRQAVEGMKMGEIKDVHTSQGLHLIQLRAYRPASNRPYAQVRDSLVTLIRGQKAKEQQVLFLQTVINENPVQVEEGGLAKLSGKKVSAGK